MQREIVAVYSWFATTWHGGHVSFVLVVNTIELFLEEFTYHLGFRFSIEVGRI